MKQTAAEAARPLFHEGEDARLFFLLPYSVRKALLRRWFNKCSVLRRSAAALHNGARFPSKPYIPILRDARTQEEKQEAKRAYYRRKRARFFVKYAIPIPFSSQSAQEDKEKMQARAAAILFMQKHGLGADLNPHDGAQKKNENP